MSNLTFFFLQSSNKQPLKNYICKKSDFQATDAFVLGNIDEQCVQVRVWRLEQ